MKGSVFFRASRSKVQAPRVKRAGTWTYQFEVPKRGGRRFVSKGGFTTKKAAENALVEALADHGRSPRGVTEPSRMALETYLRDEWLPTCSRLKPSTVNSYRFVIDTYVTPRLGEVRLCDVTAGQLVKLYDQLRSSGSNRVGKGGVRVSRPLSESTVHKVHVVLGAAFGHAAETGMLRTNPVLQVPKKNRPKQTGRARPDMRVWTGEQAGRFLTAGAGDRWTPVYDLALNTGLRRGELSGLRWVDIDFDNAVLSVRRNRVSVDHQVHEGTPKSQRARTVDLDEDTMAMLRRWRRRQREERLAWGEAWTDSGRVFTSEDGTALHPGTITWHLRRLVAHLNKAAVAAHDGQPGKPMLLPVIRLHDLRHTHATLGLAAGVPVKVMQERLGHASSQITMDLYSHVIPGMQADAAAKIGALLRSS